MWWGIISYNVVYPNVLRIPLRPDIIFKQGSYINTLAINQY